MLAESFHWYEVQFQSENAIFALVTHSNLPISKSQEASVLLKTQIQAIEQELATVEQKTVAFEATLRSALADQLIEVQELSVLYKEQKRAKKEKRLAQKKRGKNYQAPEGLKQVSEPKPQVENVGEERERKRLYREAMLHVHPDKFSTTAGENQIDLATEMTAKLIDVYKSGTLEALQSFHAHVFSGNSLRIDEHKVKDVSKDDFLAKELERLKTELCLAKARHTYEVLTEYEDPLTFIDELMIYYRDRIHKLRKRTRVKVEWLTKN